MDVPIYLSLLIIAASTGDLVAMVECIGSGDQKEEESWLLGKAQDGTTWQHMLKATTVYAENIQLAGTRVLHGGGHHPLVDIDPFRGHVDVHPAGLDNPRGASVTVRKPLKPGGLWLQAENRFGHGVELADSKRRFKIPDQLDGRSPVDALVWPFTWAPDRLLAIMSQRNRDGPPVADVVVASIDGAAGVLDRVYFRTRIKHVPTRHGIINVHGLAAATPDLVLLQEDPLTLRAINLRSGQELWRAQATLGASLPCRDVWPNGGHLDVITRGRAIGYDDLTRFDRTSGHVRWRVHDIPGQVLTVQPVAPDWVYVVSTTRESQMVGTQRPATQVTSGVVPPPFSIPVSCAALRLLPDMELTPSVREARDRLTTIETNLGERTKGAHLTKILIASPEPGLPSCHEVEGFQILERSAWELVNNELKIKGGPRGRVEDRISRSTSLTRTHLAYGLRRAMLEPSRIRSVDPAGASSVLRERDSALGSLLEGIEPSLFGSRSHVTVYHLRESNENNEYEPYLIVGQSVCLVFALKYFL